MFTEKDELKLIEKVNKMNIDELKELALKTLITREKTRLRKKRCIERKKKVVDNNEVQ